MAMACRGVRGATTVEHNEREEILVATRQLLAILIRVNGIEPDAEFPALAARQLGWLNVALLCGHELGVPGALRKCIRVLIHWNTDKPAKDIQHVYLREASRLRPDIHSLPPVDWGELEEWIAAHLAQYAKPAR